MKKVQEGTTCHFSIVIPCYNEEKTLKKCVERVLQLHSEYLLLEVIIVDDCSKDQSLKVARELAMEYPQLRVLHHEKNQGKGAALRTGFKEATGDFVAVQDADLEYDPMEFKKLLVPLIQDEADVVLGSRFLSSGAHRVLYFWHFLGNQFLTFLSNMFTDLNLTDMETCYKVFRREVIQAIEIQENRFGFEPEIVAKVAAKRLRIYEIGISYHARTYEEGKKIGMKDGFRALYCIMRYNGHCAPLPVQFLLYLGIGGMAAVVNLLVFLGLLNAGTGVIPSTAIAYIVAAAANYLLCILLLFRHKARWNSAAELGLFIFVVAIVGLADLWVTNVLISLAFHPAIAKSLSSIFGLIFNFVGRRYMVFPEPSAGPWTPQEKNG
jgi:dolichol-phosphate mannosyltransferase